MEALGLLVLARSREALNKSVCPQDVSSCEYNIAFPIAVGSCFYHMTYIFNDKWCVKFENKESAGCCEDKLFLTRLFTPREKGSVML